MKFFIDGNYPGVVYYGNDKTIQSFEENGSAVSVISQSKAKALINKGDELGKWMFKYVK